MSLSSSLFSGISGLNTLGNAMTVIGDNIANVNTVGFKASRVTFQDVLSQSVATSAGTAQVGRGTSLADISSSFAQGSFESTDSTTDLAVGGEGFFVVRDPGNEENEYYTRAGNFRFDQEGNFINPGGYIVRGWGLDSDTGEDQGSITDIKLQSFTSSPKATDKVTVIANLDADGTDNTAGSDEELSLKWDATTDPILGENAYEYQSAVQVYDSLGTTHDITIYYDKAESDLTYEYIATCNPDEDGRGCDPTMHTGAGMLARGTITFSEDGNITNMDMSRFDNSGGDWDVDTAGNWTPLTEGTSGHTTDGYFTFQPTFTSGADMDVKLNIGTRYDGASWVSDSLSTTQYASSSTTVFQSGNGYGAGDLQSITVGSDGVITGQYSNGQVIPLYRVALAKFQNEQGLYKEGENLFRETRLSGDPTTSKPGTNGLGSLSPNSLEQSNVDLANEFVKMITTQRGYQANSKIITVTDQMLAELINLKR